MNKNVLIFEKFVLMWMNVKSSVNNTFIQKIVIFFLILKSEGHFSKLEIILKINWLNSCYFFFKIKNVVNYQFNFVEN